MRESRERKKTTKKHQTINNDVWLEKAKFGAQAHGQTNKHTHARTHTRAQRVEVCDKVVT